MARCWNTFRETSNTAKRMVLGVHLEQIIATDNLVDEALPMSFTSAGFGYHPFGGVQTVFFNHPEFKAVAISELQITDQKDQNNVLVNNHELPTSVTLEIAWWASPGLVCASATWPPQKHSQTSLRRSLLMPRTSLQHNGQWLKDWRKSCVRHTPVVRPSHGPRHSKSHPLLWFCELPKSTTQWLSAWPWDDGVWGLLVMFPPSSTRHLIQVQQVASSNSKEPLNPKDAVALRGCPCQWGIRPKSHHRSSPHWKWSGHPITETIW